MRRHYLHMNKHVLTSTKIYHTSVIHHYSMLQLTQTLHTRKQMNIMLLSQYPRKEYRNIIAFIMKYVRIKYYRFVTVDTKKNSRER